MNIFYTCITGDYDIPVAPAIPSSHFKQVLITDKEPKGNHGPRWFDEVILLKAEGDRQRLARRVKVLSHKFFPDAEQTIYVDGSIILGRPVLTITRRVGSAEFAVPQHPTRRCVYDEAERIKEVGKDDPEVVDKFVKSCKANGWRPGSNLYATGLLVRRNTPAVTKLEERWWEMIEDGSVRDQLSLPVALHDLGMKPKVLPTLKRLGVQIRQHKKR